MNTQIFLINPLPDPLWCAWFAGLVDGEGCFTIRQSTTKDKQYWRVDLRVQMNVRELAYIENVQRNINCGAVRVQARPGRPFPLASWTVTRSRDIVDIIIPIFDAYPLRMKKSDEYKLWREAALLVYSKQHLDDAGFHRMAELSAALHAVKRPLTNAEIETLRHPVTLEN